jgi:uncharacterized coiled-coil protein SlyX
MNFIRFILMLIAVLLVPYAAASQTDNQPSGNLQSAEPKVCISQEAANKCAENARLIPALNEKIAALEAKIKAQDTTIEELKEANRKNVADLTDRLHKTELSLATKTGEVSMCQANDVSNRAIITAMIPMLRQKVVGIKIF